MEEDGLLTALPGGIDPATGRLRVTAFVTPRLDPGADPVPLGAFPGFADWAETSGRMLLGLEVESPGVVGTLNLEPDPASPRPDPELWRRLFADVQVGQGKFQDLSGTTVASFPAEGVSTLVRTLYATVAEQAHRAFPAATAGPLTLLHPVGADQLRRHDRRFSTHPLDALPNTSPPPGSPPNTPGRYVDRSLIAPPASPAGSVATITEALRFYDRPGATDPLGEGVVPPPLDPPKLEFHGFVSALADYPELLRRLGLALDFFIVDGEQIPEGDGRIRLETLDGPAEWFGRPAARPWTQYEIVDRRFIARPQEREQAELVDGSLRVESKELFLLEQIDLDGSAIKIASTARTVMATKAVVEDKPGTDTVAKSMTPDAASLPALRGSGLTLYRNQRAKKIVQGWDNAKNQANDQQTPGAQVDLWADDVTRGYRLDVADEADPDTWFSLQARIGDYALRTAVKGERLPLPVADPIKPDEGYTKAASATHNAAEANVAYLHEAVVGWEGWSLAAPRPGHRIGEHRVEPPEDPTREPAGFDLPLVVTFRPQPRSLPRLRFGRGYRMRARLVDMAGWSVPAEFLDPSHVTGFTPFFRWDPVPAPAVIPRRPFSEGESVLRMVIRSTLDVPAAAYAELPRITGLEGHTREDLAYRAVNERHLAAPIGSQQLAELHGRFDSAVRGSSTAAERDAQFLIAARSAGTFASPADVGLITDGKAPPRPVVLALDEHGRPLPHANLQGSGEYVLHDVDQLTLPYLPDPLALGASFTTLPGDPDTRVLDWPTDGDWFDRKPVLLRVEEGSGPPDWDPGARLLRVFLPQAEQVSVHLSSVLPREELPLMGVWMLERLPVREQQEEDAVLGRHWLLTPWSTLELVHAVEKPLAPPVIHVAEPPSFNSGVHRFSGETFAALIGTIATHAKSTGRLDLEASWVEPVDDVQQPAPQELPGQAHVGDFLLQPTEDDCRIGRNDGAPGPNRPPTHLVRHEFGDTKHRWVDYQAIATTRFREYFPPRITDRSISDEDFIRHFGPVQRLDVPSAHRPDPPQVEYVVPTWTWEERREIGVRGRFGLGFATLLPTQVRTRVGGGLRVYLSRPWFSSGADELLGVVVRQQPWLTLPLDVRAGLSAPPGVRQLADQAAEQILAAGLANGRGGRRLGAATRLMNEADAVHAAQLHTLVRGTPTDDAQLTSHLAVLDGVGETDQAAINRVRSKALTSALDAIARGGDIAEVGIGPIAALLGTGPLVTRWGSDPAWASSATAQGPYIHQFPLRSAVGTGISLPGQDEPAVVVGHQPVYDPGRRLWFCDLQLEAGEAYQPFVDLALVRYQPHSIAGHHASGVVRPGFTQLVPDRTAAVTELLGRASVAVSLRGPSGYNWLGQTFLFGSPPARIVDASHEVVAVIQTRPAGADDLDWRAAGPEVRLAASGDSLADISWHATMPLPELDAGQERRLVLTEYELFETDPSQAEVWVDRPAGGFGEAARKPVGRRLVFATEFEV